MAGTVLNFFSGRVLDEDWVDLVNRFWTVLLLALCSIGAFLARYMTTPLSCFLPPHLTSPQVTYATQTCFLEEAFTHEIPFVIPNPTQKHATVYDISWHLWVALILFLQAVCFKAPNVIWNLFKQPLMINLNDTVPALEGVQITQPEKRQALFRDAALVLSGFLDRNRFMLGSLYLGVKLLFCLNVIGQFIFLTIFFRHELGLNAGESVLNPNYTQVPVFPTKVFCKFEIRFLQNVQKYTVQCQLPINEIFTKCYVFLWYWVFFVTVITCINLVMWIGYLFVPFLRESRIDSYIQPFKDRLGPLKDRRFKTYFFSNFLGVDGIFILTMLGNNASELVAADLARHLYYIFKENMPNFDNPVYRYGLPAAQAGGESANFGNLQFGTGQTTEYVPPQAGDVSPVNGQSTSSPSALDKPIDASPAYGQAEGTEGVQMDTFPESETGDNMKKYLLSTV